MRPHLPSSVRFALHAVVGAALLLVTPLHLAMAQEGVPPLRIDTQQLRPNVYVFSGYTNGNVLLVVSDTGLLIVDAQSRKRVAALDSAMRRISSMSVRSVINTHYHADHTEGNAFYRAQGAAVIAQRNVKRQAMKDTVVTDWENWHREPLPANALPSVEYDDSLRLTIGAEPVVLYHVANAHTDGDTFVWLPRANILHTGDILERSSSPFIDFWTGGSLAGMVAGIDRAIAIGNDSTAFVPGHGEVSSREELKRYRAMLLDVQQGVRAEMARGLSVDAVIAAHPAARYLDALGGERRAAYFIRQIYYGERFAKAREAR